MTIAPNAIFFSTGDPGVTLTQVRKHLDWAVLGDDELVVETTRTGVRYIVTPTGRTRRFYGVECPTFARYDIDTVVIDGALMGVKGDLAAWTIATRPENITA